MDDHFVLDHGDDHCLLDHWDDLLLLDHYGCSRGLPLDGVFKESPVGWGLRGLSGCGGLSVATGHELWCCGVIAASEPIATSRSREMNEA